MGDLDFLDYPLPDKAVELLKMLVESSQKIKANTIFLEIGDVRRNDAPVITVLEEFTPYKGTYGAKFEYTNGKAYLHTLSETGYVTIGKPRSGPGPNHIHPVFLTLQAYKWASYHKMHATDQWWTRQWDRRQEYIVWAALLISIISLIISIWPP